MKIEQIKEETKATSPTSISQNPSSSADITTPDASATTTPAKSNLSTSACISKKLPSSTSLDSAHTSSTASSTPSANTSVKRRKSGHENSIVSTKKRSRRPTPSPATTIATVDGFSNDNINNSLFTGYASSTSMAHLPPGAHALVLPDQELYQQGLASPFVNHHPTIGSCYYPPPYPTPALMTPQQSPLTPVPHHYPHHQHISTAAAQPQPPSAVAAAAAMAAATTSTATTAIATGAMGAQQQHHLVAPFPTTMLINDDGAMIPPFQSSVLDMTTYNTPTATASPASYIPNSVYHPVIYPPPYPQPDQSAMGTYSNDNRAAKGYYSLLIVILGQ
ncbi:hypothetical protein BX666DRAFT_1439794 [Dichotomocladium elegans]|nr:hypothetical protein BX666DRAFT_1439794 [Dichotomocladium elegans]